MSQIICSNLVVGNRGRVACEDINFTIEKGDYLCIIGDNGSGKSTLIKTLLGILKPLGGTLQFGDGLTSSSIGYLPQHSETQSDFPASVPEIIRSGFLGKKKIHSLYSKKEKETVFKYIALLGLEPFSNKSFCELSGGIRQRVLLSRALCAGDELLVLDEPVSGLDPASALEMYSMVESLNKVHKISVIMVSHDMNAVERYSNKILKIELKPCLEQSELEIHKSSLQNEVHS